MELYKKKEKQKIKAQVNNQTLQNDEKQVYNPTIQNDEKQIYNPTIQNDKKQIYKEKISKHENAKFYRIIKNQTSQQLKLPKIYVLALYFFIFSFLGWVLETFYSLYELGHFTKRGFLYGPICPIYGWGAIILILFFSKYKRKNIKLFFYAAIIFSMFEYAVSYAMDALFATKWWDYTNEFFNLNGRISIFYSFVWGIAAILFVNHIYPYIKKKVNIILSKISYKFSLYLIRILSFVFLSDTAMSFVRYFK